MNFFHLDSYLDRYIAGGVPGSDCMIMQHGKVIYRKCRGTADVVNNIPIRGNELCRIYSFSKAITCTAALQLWEKGLFSLDDPLKKYLPEYADMQILDSTGLHPAEKEITLFHLFTMTAGFTYNIKSANILKVVQSTSGRCPTREIIRALADDPLTFEPGTCWNYSLCHDVLAAVIEVISGTGFNDYVKENIFSICGMPNSTFLPDAACLEKLNPFYRLGRDRQLIREYNNSLVPGPEYASGGAGCISTIEEYMRFLEHLRTGKLLSGKTLSAMASNALTAEQLETFWRKGIYGFGLGVQCPIPGGSHSDFAWGNATGGFWCIDPDNSLSLCYMQHLIAPLDDLPRQKIIEAVKKDLSL